MSLHKKALLTMGVLAAVLVIVLGLVSSHVLTDIFGAMEEQSLRRDMEHIQHLFEENLTSLGIITNGWAARDSTYAFIQDKNETFIDENLRDSTFVILNLGFVAFVRPSGEVVFARSYDPATQTTAPLPQSTMGQLSSDSLLVHFSTIESHITGMLAIPEGIFYVASYPILTGDGSGPMRGALVFGRPFDPTTFDQDQSLADLGVIVQRHGETGPRTRPSPVSPLGTVQSAPSGVERGITSSTAISTSQRLFNQPQNDRTASQLIVYDIHGSPALSLQISTPRTIYQRGIVSLTCLIGILILASLLLIIPALLLLNRSVLSRLLRLSSDITRIADHGNVSERTVVSGIDEISELAIAVNRMLEVLEASQSELQQSESDYRQLVQSVNSIILRLDKDGTIRFANRFAQAFFDFSEGELLGQNIVGSIVPSSDVADQKLKEMVQDILQNPESHTIYEHENVTKCGKSVWVSWTHKAVMSQDNQVAGILSIGYDTTERRKIEEGLRTALRKEQELNKLKSRFISTVSHNFRTPLCTILASAELLEKYDHAWDTDRRHEHFRRVKSAAKEINDMIDRVLIINRAEIGKLLPNRVWMELVPFCQEIVEDIRAGEGEHHTIEFSCSSSCAQAYIDKQLLRQILVNLLSNAVKFSAQNSSVHLDLRCDPKNAIFQISDHGVGIPAEDHGRLFEIFHRADNISHISGPGLGLTIVKKAVEVHHGTILFDSTLNEGTKFTVTLPIRPQVDTSGTG